jgi:hypothetical protein
LDEEKVENSCLFAELGGKSKMTLTTTFVSLSKSLIQLLTTIS